MKPIDLLTFAEHSEKIPTDHLVPKMKEDHLIVPFLAGHFMDFAVTVFAAAVMSSLFNQSMKMIINAKGLKGIYSEGLIVGLALPVLPLLLFSYFFFSYFFNEGQTYGMNTLKIRMKVKSASFKESFIWAAQSTFLCFSCGLSYFFVSSLQKNVARHDYRYQELFNVQEVAKIDLFSLIDNEKEEEIIHSQAA